MKAVLIDHYGSAEVLQNKEIEQPQLKPDRLLVKVYAASVNPVDWKIRNGLLKGLISTKFPTILGIDLSGEVVALGEKVTRFKPGDLVYANLGLPGGAYAEFAAVPEKKYRAQTCKHDPRRGSSRSLRGTYCPTNFARSRSD